MRKTGLMLCGTLLSLSWGAVRGAEPEGDVLFTKQQEFRIPFQLDAPESPEQAPVEVQLYVSDTQGREQWPLVDRQPPDGTGFNFLAPRDGEYWFVVRTLDRAGKLQPETEGPTEPELKVIVDATPPELTLEGLVGDSGEIMIRWQGGDAYVAADRPQIEYRSAARVDSPWRLVAVNEGLNGVAILPQMPEPIVVRAQLGDLAGNVAIVEMPVDPNNRAPIQGIPVQGRGAAAPTGPAAGPTPRAGVVAAPVAGSPVAGSPQTGYPQTERAPAGLPPTDPRSQFASAAPPAPATVPPVYRDSGNRDSGNRDSGNRDSGNRDSGNRDSGNRDSAAGDEQPQFETVDKSVKGREFAKGGSFIKRDGLPSGVKADVVNSPRFLLEYDISATGAGGVSRVELYGTTDGGETWRLVGADIDKTSPMEVQVDKNGVYGFSFVVQTGTAPAKRPERGSSPQKWVMVDTEKPKADLKGIEKTPDGDYIIHWEADDRQLAAKPITLTFSYSPSGPWFPIGAYLENTGSFTWKAGTRAPKQLYVRMTVRDLAGNTTVVDSSKIMVADRAVPQVQVRQARVPGAVLPTTIIR